MKEKLEYIESCEECKREVNLEEEGLITEGKSSLFGVYYKGKGICKDCLEKHHEEAFMEYCSVSD